MALSGRCQDLSMTCCVPLCVPVYRDETQVIPQSRIDCCVLPPMSQNNLLFARYVATQYGLRSYAPQTSFRMQARIEATLHYQEYTKSLPGLSVADGRRRCTCSGGSAS